MKTERRHELQTNDLAAWLAKEIDRVRPYGKLIGGAILVLVALALFWTWSANRARARMSTAWNEFYVVTSPSYLQNELEKKRDELRKKYDDSERVLTGEEQSEVVEKVNEAIRKLAESDAGTAPGAWAALRYADLQQSAARKGSFSRPRTPACILTRPSTITRKPNKAPAIPC